MKPFSIKSLEALPLVLTLNEIAAVYRQATSSSRRGLQNGTFRPPPRRRYPYRWYRDDLAADLTRQHDQKEIDTMTNLEKLIQAHVEGSIVTTIASSTEKVAEEIAREWLKDPAFKTEVQAIIRQHADATLAALRKNGTGRKRRGKKP